MEQYRETGRDMEQYMDIEKQGYGYGTIWRKREREL